MIAITPNENKSAQGEVFRSLALCDLCKAEITVTRGHCIPCAEFQRMVTNGFNPFTENIVVSPGVTLSDVGAAFGWSIDEQYQRWKVNALANTTDWHVCPQCYRLTRRFCANPSANSSVKL